MSDIRNARPGHPSDQIDLLERTKKKTAKPSLWHVVFLNDDFTPMEFVVRVLKQFFNKSQQEADALTMDIHLGGRGIAGTYCYEVAETKQMITMDLARKEQHPFLVRLEQV